MSSDDENTKLQSDNESDDGVKNLEELTQPKKRKMTKPKTEKQIEACKRNMQKALAARKEKDMAKKETKKKVEKIEKNDVNVLAKILNGDYGLDEIEPIKEQKEVAKVVRDVPQQKSSEALSGDALRSLFENMLNPIKAQLDSTNKTIQKMYQYKKAKISTKQVVPEIVPQQKTVNDDIYTMLASKIINK